MAGENSYMLDQATAQYTPSSYANGSGYPGPTAFNQVGMPDYLYYSHNNYSGLQYAVEEFCLNNGNVAASSTDYDHPTISEFEWAIRANPQNKPVPGHRYFFRIRSYGTNSNGTGFSSPVGDGHYDDDYPRNTTAADGSGYVYALYRSTFTYDNGAGPIYYGNRWPGATGNSNDNATTVPSSRRYIYDPTTNSYGTSAMSSVICQQNANDYRASAPYAYLDIQDFPLPVHYLNPLSSVIVNKSQVALSWSTAQEMNAKGFDIERSIDGGKDFTKIGYVASKAVNGNASTPHSYSFTDIAPSEGVNLYRLKQVDLDGQFEYSTTTSQSLVGGVNSGMKIYPNPATSVINVTNLLAGTNVRIANAAGQIVYISLIYSNSQQISVQNLPAGVYFLQAITTDGQKLNAKFIKK